MGPAVCAICGGREARPLLEARDPEGLSPEPFRLVRCACCGHRFVSPRPQGGELARYYARDYYRGAGLLARAFEASKAARLARMRPPGAVLDIGCGDGAFLEAMCRRGWEVWGIETSPEGAALARARGGLKICDTPLPDCALPAGRFDLVTLWHSIEHMEDPAAVLRQARRLLKADGVLFLAFPNAESWELSTFGSRWFHLDMPRHLHQFSLEGMQRLLSACGFKLERVDAWSWEYNLYGFVQSGLNLAGGDMNFLYRALKGRRPKTAGEWARAVWGAAAAALLLPALLPAAILYNALAALLGRSGCIEVYARPVL